MDLQSLIRNAKGKLNSSCWFYGILWLTVLGKIYLFNISNRVEQQ